MAERAVTRHLKYAWVEYGHTGDGRSFAAGLSSLGWQSLMLHLPRKTDAWGAYYVDSDHPLLPVRWKGNALMVLPNTYVDGKKYPRPILSDPIYSAYVDAHGEEAFRTEMKRLNGFLARWVFSPGIKRDSDTKALLTTGGDFTDYADLVSISGHGAGGDVWGGDSELGAFLGSAIEMGTSAPTDRLKYILIPTCYNLSGYNAGTWLPVLRRPNPVHGFLGYAESYPGGDSGAAAFSRFAEKLKENGGTKTILAAWKEAHTGSMAQSWGALLHASSAGDTMKDWLAGNLPPPEPNGEIRWYSHETYPDGVVVQNIYPNLQAYFAIEGVQIRNWNKNHPGIGLIPGKSGTLAIQHLGRKFRAGESITLVFYYYRPTKNGMDLTKLLAFSPVSEGQFELLKDVNTRDHTTNVDAIRYTFAQEASSIELPLAIAPDAHMHFTQDGRDSYGYFWMKLQPGTPEEVAMYRDGAILRGPRA